MLALNTLGQGVVDMVRRLEKDSVLGHRERVAAMINVHAAEVAAFVHEDSELNGLELLCCSKAELKYVALATWRDEWLDTRQGRNFDVEAVAAAVTEASDSTNLERSAQLGTKGNFGSTCQKERPAPRSVL